MQILDGTTLMCGRFSRRDMPIGRRWRHLRRIVRIAAGFLISEIGCERSFAVEKRQFDHRPQLSASAREDGFKIMVAGLPIERVQRSNRFWLLVQERYAKLFGMRVLRDVTQRKDTGKPQKVRKRSRKDTVTAVERARHDALKEASPHQRRASV